MEQLREQAVHVLSELSEEQLGLVLAYAQCVRNSEQVELKTGETVLFDAGDLAEQPG